MADKVDAMGLDRRRRVAEELLARLPELTRRAVDAVRQTIPAYRELGPDQLRDVGAITAWGARRVLELWTGQREFDDVDRRRFRAIGAVRAEDGRPISAVLRAYRVAALAVSTEVTDLARHHRLDLDDVAALTAVLLAALDELSEALLAGYTARRDRLRDDHDRARRDLLDDLIIGRQSSPDALADRCRELGITLPAAPLLVVAEPVDPAEAATPLPTLAAGLATVRGRRAVLLLDPSTASVTAGATVDSAPAAENAAIGAVQRVADELAGRGWRGCAISSLGVDAVSTAFRLATDALDTAPAHSFAGRVLLVDADAYVLGLLAARPTADPAATARAVLGPLTEPGQRHLFDGLVAYLSTGSATAAAAQLSLHAQTLRYRLRRVRELTGRDPHDPWQRFTLDVARHVTR